MKKKEYTSPELTLVLYSLQNPVMASGPEGYNDYLDDGNDDWGSQDPGDIIWD